MRYINYFKSINPFSILLLFLIIAKFYIAFISFGSGDLTGLSLKYLFQYNSFDLSESGNLVPYFTFVELIYFYSGKIAQLFEINYVFILKCISVLFEIFLAFLIFYLNL